MVLLNFGSKVHLLFFIPLTFFTKTKQNEKPQTATLLCLFVTPQNESSKAAQDIKTPVGS